jgi:hypothetical protein
LGLNFLFHHQDQGALGAAQRFFGANALTGAWIPMLLFFKQNEI